LIAIAIAVVGSEDVRDGARRSCGETQAFYNDWLNHVNGLPFSCVSTAFSGGQLTRWSEVLVLPENGPLIGHQCGKRRLIGGETNTSAPMICTALTPPESFGTHVTCTN
jgi:hypothetical protein